LRDEGRHAKFLFQNSLFVGTFLRQVGIRPISLNRDSIQFVGCDFPFHGGKAQQNSIASEPG
jgi:hypothetical protein